jgi:hypothetical protein
MYVAVLCSSHAGLFNATRSSRRSGGVQIRCFSRCSRYCAELGDGECRLLRMFSQAKRVCEVAISRLRQQSSSLSFTSPPAIGRTSETPYARCQGMTMVSLRDHCSNSFQSLAIAEMAFNVLYVPLSHRMCAVFATSPPTSQN